MVNPFSDPHCLSPSPILYPRENIKPVLDGGACECSVIYSKIGGGGGTYPKPHIAAADV